MKTFHHLYFCRQSKLLEGKYYQIQSKYLLLLEQIKQPDFGKYMSKLLIMEQIVGCSIVNNDKSKFSIVTNLIFLLMSIFRSICCDITYLNKTIKKQDILKVLYIKNKQTFISIPTFIVC